MHIRRHLLAAAAAAAAVLPVAGVAAASAPDAAPAQTRAADQSGQIFLYRGTFYRGVLQTVYDPVPGECYHAVTRSAKNQTGHAVRFYRGLSCSGAEVGFLGPYAEAPVLRGSRSFRLLTGAGG
jgi:hypothetical protein